MNCHKTTEVTVDISTLYFLRQSINHSVFRFNFYSGLSRIALLVPLVEKCSNTKVSTFQSVTDSWQGVLLFRHKVTHHFKNADFDRFTKMAILLCRQIKPACG